MSDVTSPVTFINRFTAVTSPAEFEQIFAVVADFFRAQPGFREYTLLRERDSADSYVNVARWDSLEDLLSAVRQPGFQRHAAGIRALSRSEATVYTPCVSVGNGV